MTQSFFVVPPDNAIANPQRLPDGSFQLAFYGTVGSNYTLQASRDLTNWSSLFNFACTDSPTIVVDTTAKNFSSRFYRVAQLSAVNSGVPLITVRLAGSNVVILWPTNATGFALESITNLALRSWTTNSSTPAIVNGQYAVTNAISGEQKFYRLRK